MVWSKLTESDGYGRMEIYREASLATRPDESSQPLISTRTIRDWMRLIRDVSPDYLLLVRRGVLNFEHLEADYRLKRDGLIHERGEAIRWALDEPNIAPASVMEAHFRNVDGETPEQYYERRVQTTFGTIRQLIENAPPEKAEAASLILKGINAWTCADGGP